MLHANVQTKNNCTSEQIQIQMLTFLQPKCFHKLIIASSQAKHTQHPVVAVSCCAGVLLENGLVYL